MEIFTNKYPYITEDGESSVRLPFDDFNEANFPKVINIHSFQTFHSIFFLKTICFNFQEYKRAMRKLRAAYYSGSTDPDVIKRENIALMSDLNFSDSVLKTLKLQARANGGDRSTYFFRWDSI